MTQIKKQTARDGEQGNVLFLILIAVALFAALSYAVTQSSRSGGGDAGRETNIVSGAQVTQYPAGVRTSILRMIVSNNADQTTLEFNSPSAYSDCTAGFARCVFHPTGGGATYVLAPGEVMTSGNPTAWVFNGENEIFNVGTSVGGDGQTAATSDVIAFLNGVSTNVCERINERLGLPTDLTTVVETAAIDTTTQMVNPDGATPTSIGFGGGTIGEGGAVDLNGQPFGCFRDSGGNNVYYHVLIER